MELLQLRERVLLLEAVIDNFPGGILLTDKNLNVVVCNRQQRNLLDYPDTLFEDNNPTLRELFHFNAARGEYGPGDVQELVSAKMELVRRREPHIFERTRPNGRIVEIRGAPLSRGGFVTSYVDVTEHRKNQQLIAELALKDPLTGLANRNLLKERIDQALARARRGEGFAIHYIDLDRFKPINDQHGHEAGDRVLIEVARRLQAAVREVDTVARVGGDEFVVLQSNARSSAAAGELAVRLMELFKPTIAIKGIAHAVGASIGVAVSDIAAGSMDEMLRRADAALYVSKNGGRGRYAVHQDDPLK